MTPEPDTNPDAVTLLSDDEVAEIEAHLKRLAAPGEPWESKTEKADTFQNVAARHALALCATVRALRRQVDEWESHRRGFIELFETAEARVTDLEAENTALHEQLAEARAENQRLRESGKRMADELGHQDSYWDDPLRGNFKV